MVNTFWKHKRQDLVVRVVSISKDDVLTLELMEDWEKDGVVLYPKGHIYKLLHPSDDITKYFHRLLGKHEA